MTKKEAAAILQQALDQVNTTKKNHMIFQECLSVLLREEPSEKPKLEVVEDPK